ncbi:hypothetical protein C3433_24820 [Citrobacter freundii]|uniref:Uncharacterized protein n=1 Tax=Citrobacter arsenatis TaxID=2546350 RepID=A0A4P6WE49_9ENTR|nr:hypothetical protein C3433_24820 [Citrobacter freundii]QBM21219.1 hypothetical protein E1B03_01715 [Citrobacter arsenatis]
MPVAIQQSPEKYCTNLVHYSFLHQKSAKKQVVSGEKSPSRDGLKVPRQLKPSSFSLQLCWLLSLTPVTYLCKLPGIHSIAALL